jgi:hypothetical protein
MCKNYTSPKKNQCLILWEKSSRKKALDEEMFQILTLSDVEYTIFNAFKKFFIGFFFFVSFSTYASHIAGMTGMHHHIQLLVEMEFHFFPRLTLNCNPPNFHLPSSWYYK